MIAVLLSVNSVLLLAFVSMYFGTGWSLLLFSFPSARDLTVDNYYPVFVPPVQRATRFFTTMTKAMIASTLIMTVGEWRTGFVWVPLTVLVLVIVSTVLTVKWIFPPNKRMEAGITDPAVLRQTLRQWISLNRIRTALWTLQWLVMAVYFAVR